MQFQMMHGVCLESRVRRHYVSFLPKDALATFVRQSRVQLAELTEQLQVRLGSHSFWRGTKVNKKGRMKEPGSNWCHCDNLVFYLAASDDFPGDWTGTSICL